MKTPKNTTVIISGKAQKSSSKSTLPVSKKAYDGFIDRIRAVYASDATCASIMIDTLDRYLGGDRNASDRLDDSMRMAFEFLRHDVDVAMERSRRARERARLRREAADSQENKSERNTDDDKESFEAQLDERLQRIFRIVEDDEIDEAVDDAVFSRPLTRRERRACERAARGKSRIKPLYTRVG